MASNGNSLQPSVREKGSSRAGFSCLEKICQLQIYHWFSVNLYRNVIILKKIILVEILKDNTLVWEHYRRYRPNSFLYLLIDDFGTAFQNFSKFYKNNTHTTHFHYELLGVQISFRRVIWQPHVKSDIMTFSYILPYFLYTYPIYS